MKILIVASFAGNGGAQIVAEELRTSMALRGHQVTLKYLYSTTRREAQCAHQAAVLKSVPVMRLRHYLALPFHVVREMRASRPQAVIAHMPLACVISLLIATLMRVQVRIAVQHVPPTEYKPAMRLLDKLCGSSRVYTTNVVVSRSVLQAFSRYPVPYRARQIVIANGRSFERRAEQQEVTRERYGLPRAELIALFCGRLVPQKDPAFLLTLLPHVPCHLAYAGTGELEDELRLIVRSKKLTGRVHFLGQLDRTAVWNVLWMSNVFLMPSKYEGMSLALLEAISVGLPVLATDISANREVLQPPYGEPCGLLLPPGDTVSWIEALRKIISDERSRAELSSRATERSTKFTLSAMSKRYEAIMERDRGAVLRAPLAPGA